MNYNRSKFNWGFWCDKHQDEVNRGDLVKGTRYDDDECLHGVCKECYEKLSDKEKQEVVSGYDN